MGQPEVRRIRPPRLEATGFTTIELVIIIVLIGVLAFVAIPRLNTDSLRVIPVAEQIAGEIRYAQNLAMTRSQAHTFSIGGGGYEITRNGTTVPLSNGESAGSYGNLDVSAVSITFSPRFGEPDNSASISVSGGGNTVSVVVEGETGYVRIIE